jgi:hypothetical protein
VKNWLPIKLPIFPTEGTYEMGMMEILVGMALQCIEEDKDERPTMSQVVEMLLSHDNDHYNYRKLHLPPLNFGHFCKYPPPTFKTSHLGASNFGFL